MDLGITGRPALVTGASAGIGFAVARALAAEGARVAMCSRDTARITKAAARVRAEGTGEPVALAGDLSRAGEPDRVVNEAAGALGGLAILVTNVGGPRSGNFRDLEEEDFAGAVELTLRSVERLIRAAVPHFRTNGAGRIVNLTSITAKEPHEGLVLSNTLRPAVHGLAKSLSRELGATGIAVNSVCTGFTSTERLQELADASATRQETTAEEIFAGWRSRIPRGELGRPEEIADVVAFLCSERASFVNGVSLAVDGGESHALL